MAHRDRSLGSPLVVAVLLLTIGLTGALAYLAQDAVRTYREMTDRILGDYASLAANSYARRIAAELEGYAFDPALKPLRSSGKAGDVGALPATSPVLVWIDQETEIPVDLVRYNFSLRLDEGDLAVRGDSLAPAARAWLADTVRAHARSVYSKDWPSAALVGVADGAAEPERIIVYTVVRDSAGEPVRAAGFEAKPSGLEVYFDYAMKVWPLIPPPLTRGTPTDSLVSIVVTSPTNRVVYKSPWQNESPIAALDSLGARFGNLVVSATLDPDARRLVVLSGPPRAHLPLLAGLSFASMALVVTAIMLIRRERELARLRSDFVASVSHELRTPLAQIRLFAETLLLGRVRTPDEKQRSLEIIGQEAMRLSRLVDNVLHVSRSERRALTLSLEPTDLSALAREVVAGFAPVAEARDVRLRVEADGAVRALADPAAVRQILVNLIDNAVKYGPERQTVVVGVALENGRALLRVDDQGAGVPPRDRERIWERFVRLPPEPAGAVVGTGIGLSVVRELVALHGGKAWVEESPSRGARFTVSLPTEARPESEPGRGTLA